MVKEIEQTKVIYEAVLDTPTRLSHTADEVLDALTQDRHPVVEIPWGERIGDELYEHHQIVLTRLQDERVYFANSLPNAQEVAAGAVLGGPEQGPERRMEGSGEQSMTVVLFRELLSHPDSSALIPGS